MASSGLSTLEQLAGLATGLRADEVPGEVVRQAGDRLLDGLGCMLAGARAATVRHVYDAVSGAGGTATLVGGGRRATPADATLANTTALRYLDFMDGHPGPYPCHPSLTVPAALAAAEAGDASGLELLRAIVLCYELDIRLQLGSGDPDVTAHGWSGSTNVGLAVPFGIGGLLGLSEQQLGNALAIATVHSPTLDASGHGQMAASKAAVDGMVAASAVTATLLARGGLGGKLTAFEGEDGFVPTVSRFCDEAVVLAPLRRFRIMDVYTKLYNTVKCGQTAVAAGLEVRDRIGTLDDIEKITVRLSERDWRNQLQDESARRRPSNRDTGNHSAVYCVAAALVAGDLQSAQFEPDRLRDPRTLALVDRIELEPDQRYTSYWPGANPAGVRVSLADGQVLEAERLYSPGHPQNRLSRDQLTAKFRTQAEPSLGPERTDEVIELVARMPELDTVEPLMAAVSGGDGR